MDFKRHMYLVHDVIIEDPSVGERSEENVSLLHYMPRSLLTFGAATSDGCEE